MNLSTIVSAGFRQVLLCALPLALLPIPVRGQGTVIFSNHQLAAGLQVRIYGPEVGDPTSIRLGNTATGLPPGTTTYSGTLLAGSDYRVQLLAAPGANMPSSLLQISPAIATFRTGSASGIWATTNVTLTGIPADAPVATVQAVAWHNPSGAFPTWAEAYHAWLSGIIPAGKSVPFDVRNLGGGTNPIPALTNLESFNIYYGASTCKGIARQPQDLAVAAGQDAAFRVFIGGGPVALYQWKFNGQDIPGATNDSLTITDAQPADAGIYTVLVAGDLLSREATLTVSAPPTILAQPTNVTVKLDSPAALTVSAIGPGMAYQWMRNGAALPGGTTSAVVIPSASHTDAGTYQVEITNAFGGVTSSIAVLTVLDPYIVANPQGRPVSARATVSLDGSAGGTTPLGYQWCFEGSPLPGATNTLLTLSNFQPTNAGAYTFVATNTFGAVTSAPAGLTFTNQGGATVLFGNWLSNVLKSPVYGPDPNGWTRALQGNTASGIPPGTQDYAGFLVSGVRYRAQLFAADGGGQPLQDLTAASPATTFRTGSASGFLPLSVATLASVPVDATAATIQLRAWDNESGLYPDWSSAQPAWLSGMITAGFSLPFTVTNLGGGTNLAPVLAGLESFNLYHIVPPWPVYNQGLQIQVQNPLTPYCEVLASSNLVDWFTLGFVTNTSGTILFSDPASTNLPSRFYQVILH